MRGLSAVAAPCSTAPLIRRSSEIAPDPGLQKAPSLSVKRTASSRPGSMALAALASEILLMLSFEAMGGRTKARVKTPSPDRPTKVQKETVQSGHGSAEACRSASYLRGYWHRAPQQGRFLEAQLSRWVVNMVPSVLIPWSPACRYLSPIRSDTRADPTSSTKGCLHTGLGKERRPHKAKTGAYDAGSGR